MIKIINVNYYDEIIKDCKKIAIKKNIMYGSEGLKRFGLKGIVCRLGDKQDRLVNMTWNNQKDLNNESIEDTLKDMLNYCIYSIMVLNGKLEMSNKTNKRTKS